MHCSCCVTPLSLYVALSLEKGDKEMCDNALVAYYNLNLLKQQLIPLLTRNKRPFVHRQALNFLKLICVLHMWMLQQQLKNKTAPTLKPLFTSVLLLLMHVGDYRDYLKIE